MSSVQFSDVSKSARINCKVKFILEHDKVAVRNSIFQFLKDKKERLSITTGCQSLFSYRHFIIKFSLHVALINVVRCVNSGYEALRKNTYVERGELDWGSEILIYCHFRRWVSSLPNTHVAITEYILCVSLVRSRSSVVYSHVCHVWPIRMSELERRRHVTSTVDHVCLL